MREEFFRIFQTKRPLILGHRGAKGLSHENSLESFRAAFEAGADGVELDVRRTKDGVLITHHDEETVSGHATGEHSLEELRRMSPVPIVRLNEVFREFSGRGFLDIELKEAGYEEQVTELARRLLPARTYAYSSFLDQVVAACRKFDEDTPAILIRENNHKQKEMLAALVKIDASGVAFNGPAITEQSTAFYHEQQFTVFAWTINSVREAKRLAALGVAGIITDVPEKIVRAVR